MDIKYNKKFYIVFKEFVKLWMPFYYKIEIEGIENLPTENNYVLAGNHLNIYDSWLLICAVDKEVRFMVDKKLYKRFSWELFFKSLGTFGISPDETDIKAVRTAIELLKDNYIVGIFPEGHTHSEDIELPFKPGVPKIASSVHKEIVPFGISGTYKPFSRLKLTIGSPINYRLSGIPKSDWDTHLEQEVRKLEKKSKNI